jgi:hypothetical protein
VMLPVADGTFYGVVDGQSRSVTRTGLADPRIRWSLNVVGSPATRLEDFARYKQRTIFGVALQVIVPLGQYDPDRLINLGSNRFSFIPEIGVSHDTGKWTIELGAEAWFFTDNTNYLDGSTRSQDPLLAAQFNVIYEFRPGVWLSLGGAYANGGESTVNGEFSSELQSNSRSGVTFAYPIDRRNGISVNYARGIATRLGADFDNITLAYQHMFGGPRMPGHK